jgi:Ran-binding protein 3
MRKDAVYTVILNITLFSGMRCSLAQDPRYLRVSAIENGLTTTYNIKVSNAGIARDLMEEINSNIPL